jgi:hypothetical protein
MASTYFGSGDGASTLDYFKYKNLQVSPEFKPKGGDFTSGDWSWDKAGKFNETAEKLKKDPLNKSGTNWGEALSKASSYRDQAERKGERDDALRNLPYMLDRGSRGSGGQVFEGFGYINPTQHGPIVLPGVQSGRGGGGLLRDIGGLAGTLGTAAGIFGPLGAPIGMGVGGLIDRFAGT